MMSKQKISKEQVNHIADLARIKLSPTEIKNFQLQLSQILSYIDHINEIDTRNIKPISQVNGLLNITESDSATHARTLSQTHALSNAPEKEERYFKVKPVL